MSDDTAPQSQLPAAPLVVKRGPGRPRKDSVPGTVRPRTSSAESTVESAAATMRAIYGAFGAGFLMAKLYDSAEYLAERKDELNAANMEAFRASPKLAELIAGAAPIASVSAFAVAHFTVGLGLVGTVRKELQDRKPVGTEVEDASDGFPAATPAPYMG